MLTDEQTQRLKRLGDQFSRASSDWPNLEGILLWWTEGKPELDLPQFLMPQGAVPVPTATEQFNQKEGPLPDEPFDFVPIYGSNLDKPAARFRKGFSGMLTWRRDFHQFGDPTIITDPATERACWDRFKTLSTECVERLDWFRAQISSETLAQPAWIRWTLAVHELSNFKVRDLEPDAHYTIANDLFLSSASVVDLLFARQSDGYFLTYEEICKGVGLGLSTVRGYAQKAEGVRIGKPGKSGHMFSLREVKLIAACHIAKSPQYRENWLAFIQKHEIRTPA